MSNTTTAPAVMANFDAAALRLHISDGNTKTGAIPNYSTLPTGGIVRRKDGTPVTGEYGTCAGVCNGCAGACYAVRALRYTGTARAWSENTTLIRENPLAIVRDVSAYLDKKRTRPALFRFHVGGEFMPSDAGLMELRSLAILARKYPETVFFGYTKRSALLLRYKGIYGDMPQNLRVLVSMWNGTVTNYTNAPMFHYDDGTDETLQGMRHCPAVDRNGRKTGVSCAACRMCATAKDGDNIAVYAH